MPPDRRIGASACAAAEATPAGPEELAPLGRCGVMVNTPSSPATAVTDLVSPRRDWVIAGVALALGLCAFGFIFRSEIATAVYVWSDSYAYNHCFLILPVAAYLVWDRRQAVAATVPRPAPWIALLAIPTAAAWFAADRLGVMEGRQLMAMTLFQVMAAALLGPGAWRTLAAPLLYLFFLVPFGEFIIPPLQSLTVHFTGISLDLLGIPNFIDGYNIAIPEGTFRVEQACAGIRFLFAMAAFAVPYVLLMYASPRRRAFFVALFLAAAVIGNSLRVVGTLLIAHFTGNVKLIEAEHVYWGWVFYVLVGLALILIGLPFRQEQRSPVNVAPMVSRRTASASLGVLALVVLLAAAPRVAADVLNRLGAGAAAAARIEMPLLPECSEEPLSAAAPAPPVADEFRLGVGSSRAYRCDGELFLLSLYRYPPRIGARPLWLSLRAAETQFSADDTIVQAEDFRAGAGRQAPLWRVTQASAPDGRFVAVATAVWLNGRPSGTGIAARVDQALNTVRRSAVSPVLAVVTHVAESGPNDARQAIDQFLPRTAQLSEWVDNWLAEPITR
jgi:exosortase A